MTQPTMSQALAEAYNHAPADMVRYHTLEFHHSSLRTPLRAVASIDDIIAKLETSAPVDGGKTVTFMGVPFQVQSPSQGVGPTPQMSIQFTNIGTPMMQLLDDASMGFETVTCIYRAYTNTTLNDGPQLTPPPMFQVISTTGTDVITAILRPLDLTKVKFPKETHDVY